MSERKRYPENAAGDFYVEEDLCIVCGGPAAVAPELVELSENRCYFKKQPCTEAELQLAIDAVNACCCGAYRYGGNDKEVIAKLKYEDCDRA